MFARRGRDAMDEFDLIRRCFAPLATSPGADGLRDDVAVILHDVDDRLIATADTIVEGIHFLPDDPIDTVAAKLVRVNASDIVAKGGRPDGALLMLTWPRGRRADGIDLFAARLGKELARWGGHLIGGDTSATDGPLVLSLTLLGRCGRRGPVRRMGAGAGDDVWVTGAIGDGWLGLRAARGMLDGSGLSEADRARLAGAYRAPEPPPLAFAGIVAQHASASIDVSDGLVADAGHLAAASGVALVVAAADTPLSDVAMRWLATAPEADIRALLTGGDDYQTLFTARPTAAQAIRDACAAADIRVTRIGRVERGEGVSVIDGSGRALEFDHAGWRHFSGDGPAGP